MLECHPRRHLAGWSSPDTRYHTVTSCDAASGLPVKRSERVKRHPPHQRPLRVNLEFCKMNGASCSTKVFASWSLEIRLEWVRWLGGLRNVPCSDLDSQEQRDGGRARLFETAL